MQANRRNLVVIAGLVLAGWCNPVPAQNQGKVASNPNPPRKEEPKEISLDLTRQKLPDPLFRYRLVPFSSELNPGNAAQVYLRLNEEFSSERILEMHRRSSELIRLPLTGFPQEEAAKLIEDFAGRLRQLEFGTRRQYCDWDYTILEEKDSPFTILLPDAQAMRSWGFLLGTKLRAEIAKGQTEQAIQTLETGFAFGRHVGSGPFFINKLIGMAILAQMLAQLDDLIGQPGTPNLYWALTTLPQPLINMREAVESERVSLGRAMTGQTLDEFDTAKPRTDAEWSAVLAAWHVRMIRMENLTPYGPNAPHRTIADLAAYKTAMLLQARDYVRNHHLTTTSDDQTLVVTLISMYRELADENFKMAYIPYPAAVQHERHAIEQVQAAKSGPASSFVQMLPATSAVLMSEVRLNRKVAALRVVEALRLYAADHDGALPATLDQIKAVPIPPDPVTGQPFRYSLDKTTALLEETKPLVGPHLAYRITIRP